MNADVEIWPCSRHRRVILSEITPWQRAHEIASACPSCNVLTLTPVARPGDETVSIRREADAS